MYSIPVTFGVSAVDGIRRIRVSWVTNTIWDGYHVSVSALDSCSPAYYTINNSFTSSKLMGRNCQGYRHIYETPTGQTLPLYVKVRTYAIHHSGTKFLGDWSNTVVLDC